MQPDFIRYTLIFLRRGNTVLMLHRQNPPNRGLWNGVGGRIEPGESPMDCAIREVREETGFLVPNLHYAGVVTWDGFETPPGGLYVYTAEAPPGDPLGNGEGVLAWQPIEWVLSAEEVVSNIHIFGPLVFNGSAPREFHFHYSGGEILKYEIRDLPLDWSG